MKIEVLTDADAVAGKAAAFIAAERLTFLGFHLDARTLRAYAARFPDDVTMTNLAHWDAFERTHPNVFAAMYQFCVQKA